MGVVFFFSLIALLLTVLDSRQTLKNGMKYGSQPRQIHFIQISLL